MKFKSIQFFGILACLAAGTSGCIVAPFTFPINPGIFLLVASGSLGSMLLGGCADPTDCRNAKGNWYYLGIVLDEKSPGRSELVNPVPLDESIAKKFSVSMNDLEQYNFELPSVQSLDLQVNRDLKYLVDHRFANAEVEAVGIKYGFANRAAMSEIFSHEKASNENVKAFAEATHVSQASAKIYLQERFKVKVE